MFRDRATQFRDRLNWQVEVDTEGFETDQYDHAKTLYVIAEGKDGLHQGSMRFLPTTGPVMVNDYFADIAGRAISDPLIWECTRFCLAPNAPGSVAALLMLGGAELGAGLGLRQAVGVFDTRMIRIYRMLRWSPMILGTQGSGRDAISVGIWTFGADVTHRMALAAGVSPALSRNWFSRTFEARDAA